MAAYSYSRAVGSVDLTMAPEQMLLMEGGEEADVEIQAPAQKRMLDAPEHGAWFQSLGGGSPAKPGGSDGLYTKVLCLSCGVGELLGSWVVGNGHQCFCVKGQGYCGLGGSDGCPAADVGCDMYKPTGDCSTSCKILCCKAGIDCPEKPWVVCNGNSVFN